MPALSAMSYDPELKRVVIVILDYSLQSWNGTEWEVQLPISTPPPMVGFPVVRDPTLGLILLVGRDPRTSAWLNGTWRWDGGGWVAIALATPESFQNTMLSGNPAISDDEHSVAFVWDSQRMWAFRAPPELVP